jgi:hypothetical protein
MKQKKVYGCFTRALSYEMTLTTQAYFSYERTSQPCFGLCTDFGSSRDTLQM